MADRRSAEQLRQQIRDQEQRIENLESTITKMLPGRRDILKAGGAAVGAAVLGASTGTATADSPRGDHDGRPGSPEDCSGVFDDGIDAGPGGKRGPHRDRVASPGEVQATIDVLASRSDVGIGPDQSRGLVRLKSGLVYDEGSEIHVRPGIVLDFEGAVLTHSHDHNILFMDNGSHARNVRIAVDGDSFTSDAVVLDTTRSIHGKYSIDATGGPQNKHVTVDGTILGDSTQATGGTGVALRDGADVGITMGCKFDVEIYHVNVGMGFYTGEQAGGSFINFGHVDVSITGCETLINHTGAAPAKSYVTGDLQPTSETEYSIRNQTTNDDVSVTFDGQFWDPHRASEYAVAGPHIRIWAKHRPGLDRWVRSDHFDGSSGQAAVAMYGSRFQLYSGQADNCWEMVNDSNGHLAFVENGQSRIRISEGASGSRVSLSNDDGSFVSLVADGSGLFRVENPDSTVGEVYFGLKASAPHSPSGTGDIYVDDGTNTSSSDPGWRVDDPADSTWKDM